MCLRQHPHTPATCCQATKQNLHSPPAQSRSSGSAQCACPVLSSRRKATTPDPCSCAPASCHPEKALHPSAAPSHPSSTAPACPTHSRDISNSVSPVCV